MDHQQTKIPGTPMSAPALNTERSSATAARPRRSEELPLGSSTATAIEPPEQLGSVSPEHTEDLAHGRPPCHTASYLVNTLIRSTNALLP
jgi:hypothetical protein